MLWVHLSFLSREGNPEPQNQKHIIDLMNVISEKEKISNWVIYSKVSNMQKDFDRLQLYVFHKIINDVMYYISHVLEELLGQRHDT